MCPNRADSHTAIECVGIYITWSVRNRNLSQIRTTAKSIFLYLGNRLRDCNTSQVLILLKECLTYGGGGIALAFDDNRFIQVRNFTLAGNILSDNYNSQSKNSMNSYFEGFTEDYELTYGQNNLVFKNLKYFN